VAAGKMGDEHGQGNHLHRQRVEFGDCDPARIVWFPNFFRWIDAASRHFFVECGVPDWHETEKTLGVIGTPLVDTHAKFMKTASYGDVLQIHISIPEWRGKSFVQRYRMMRGATRSWNATRCGSSRQNSGLDHRIESLLKGWNAGRGEIATARR
jgi:4-hydroxybenzoyl-CoA thioesterase